MLIPRKVAAVSALSLLLLLSVVGPWRMALAADAEEDGDAAQEYDYNNWKQQTQSTVEVIDDNIQYWTSFHIQAKRCVVFKNKDIIVFDIFSSGDQCGGDHLVGTYSTPVPYYMQGYMDEVAQKNQDRGVDDYVEPEVAQYRYCTPKEVNGQMLYLQLGCADDSTQSIAVNAYKDNTCETKAPDAFGTDDANMDISDIQIKFKKCQACVNWVNKDDESIDDQFYENRQMLAPLCSTAWAYKEKCGKKCQRLGLKEEREHWKRADIILLSFEMAFGAIMGALIYRKRQKMSSKDALLEQASINAAGLQIIHVALVAGFIVMLVVIFASLGFVNLTLTLILIIDGILFAYLMKVTYETSVSEPIIGPDGEILEKADSDDSEEEEGSRESDRHEAAVQNHGTYVLPTIA